VVAVDTALALHRPKLDRSCVGSHLLSEHVLGAAPSGHIRSVHKLSKLKHTPTSCSHKFGASGRICALETFGTRYGRSCSQVDGNLSRTRPMKGGNHYRATHLIGLTNPIGSHRDGNISQEQRGARTLMPRVSVIAR